MTTEFESTQDRDERLLAELLRAADDQPVDPPAELTDRVRTQLIEQTHGVRPSRAIPRQALGRTKQAFVRCGVIAALVGILMVIGVGLQTEKHLLADVADAIAKHRTVRFTTEGDKGTPGTGYWTLDSMHFRVFHVGMRRTFDYGEGKILLLDPETKTGRLIKFDPKHVGEPRLEQLLVIRDEGDAEPARDVLDRREVLVYRVLRLRNHETRRTVIWADPVTLLPVRIEQTTTIQKPEREPYENKHVMKDFVWDPPEIEDVEQFFSVTPPEDYEIEFVDADNP